ncbi:hypothetical protein PISMIDRAFT_438860 [Pisolithus microcarpus 441]|uniref:Uncharacterized protein n=1 Tax=Pisolithus microcarpus 441 TaxID=765257 RepID=A0A0C9ZK54_9AGAM|nr:hypothetical protein PISMIDRAFT_438860 [Pisolithus microcarpus 441]
MIPATKRNDHAASTCWMTLPLNEVNLPEHRHVARLFKVQIRIHYLQFHDSHRLKMSIKCDQAGLSSK